VEISFPVKTLHPPRKITLLATRLSSLLPSRPAAVVSQFESRDLETDLWLLVTPTMRRAGSVQPHLVRDSRLMLF